MYKNVAEYNATKVPDVIALYGNDVNAAVGAVLQQMAETNVSVEDAVAQVMKRDGGVAGQQSKGVDNLINKIIFEGADKATKLLRRKAFDEFSAATKGVYSTAVESANAFMKILKEQDPWPLGFDKKASKTTLKPGQRFEMALGPKQKEDRPGGFGTFDKILDVNYVRNQLAVKSGWKKDIDRVVVYEVIEELPVISGPVGPQIDEANGRYLPGSGHQIQMLVSAASRMKYLRVVEVRSIN